MIDYSFIGIDISHLICLLFHVFDYTISHLHDCRRYILSEKMNQLASS